VQRSRHDVAWDEQKIGEFWRIVSDVNSDQFFARRSGDVFLDTVKGDLGHKILDVGCGHGVLVHEMRKRGYDAVGSDPAPPDDPYLFRMRGTDLDSLGGGRFDTVVSLETFEHVVPAQLPATLAAIGRVLKPGGKLIFTVPFEEDMRNQAAVCPDCHAVFHRWQHQQSFSREALAKLLRSAGFEPLSFRVFDVPFSISFVPRFLRMTFCSLWARLRARLRRPVSVLVIARRGPAPCSEEWS
jgi:2-polyprenyl-3-methyl-5-hydroxy-6-metoxy-1,4-benzoquinol methylase